jgi:two-component system, OmpR family, phosphate regulon sensor histidine kinase PhoR
MTTLHAALLTLAVALLVMAVCAWRMRRLRREHDEEVRSWELRLAQELKQARSARNQLLDALGDAFFIVDSSRNIRFANLAADTLFSGRELIGRPVREVFLDPRLAEALLRCIETGEPAQSRVVLSQQSSPRGDSENRGINAWVIDAAPLSTSPDGNLDTRVVIRDVTTEHQLEQIRKDFVANASHELRTPLAIISGYLENLLEDDVLEETETARHFLGIMQKHTERISRIVEDMLVISRLESGEAGSLNIEPFRISACINDVLERLESVVRNQAVAVEVRLEDPEQVIHADRFYWTQVLFNLVENALKQNPHHGLKVEIGCITEPDGALRLWVADNGIGIPSADLPHIFRRFYRVAKHHSQQQIKGTGLGLSIVKRAVEAHNGQIEVTSIPGQDTRFTITLPHPAGD